MTLEEAINIIDIAIAEVEWCYPLEYAEAFEMTKEALKKQKATKVEKEEWLDDYDLPFGEGYYCSKCGEYLGSKNTPVLIISNYCPHCGRKLDWSEYDKD